MVKSRHEASDEQFAPRPLLQFAVQAEAADFDILPRLRQRYA